MFARRLTIQLAFFIAAVLPTRALAGVVDSPIPAPFTQQVFTVPGVINSAGIGAFFSCTNLDAVNVTIGVEIFGSAGGAAVNDVAGTSLSVLPGATKTFGTPAVGISIDSNYGVGGFLTKGSARILATSKKITCTAYVADLGNAPPTVAWQLTIIAKTKQKAAN